MTRIAQIEKCASCHNTIYDNWKLGPHSNAFLRLEMHNNYLDSSKNFPTNYNRFVNTNMKEICITCHTGQNLYETNFAGINHQNTFNPDSLPNIFHQALGRNFNNKKELTSGVDCITCHVQKNQVVTHNVSSAPDSLGIIKSVFFTSNMNCYSCHHLQVGSMKELVKEKKISSEISCISCHQEYDHKKQGTHYFYWRNNPTSKSPPLHLNIFETIKLVSENKNNKQFLNFNWTNTLMPHDFSECGEAKCTVIGVYKNKKEIVYINQYINRKDFFDTTDMPEHFRFGKNGNQFKFKEPILKEVEVMNWNQLDHWLILGYVKPQYWSNEKEFVLIFSKKIAKQSL